LFLLWNNHCVISHVIFTLNASTTCLPLRKFVKGRQALSMTSCEFF
jgi:hypothetical protein